MAATTGPRFASVSRINPAGQLWYLYGVGLTGQEHPAVLRPGQVAAVALVYVAAPQVMVGPGQVAVLVHVTEPTKFGFPWKAEHVVDAAALSGLQKQVDVSVDVAVDPEHVGVAVTVAVPPQPKPNPGSVEQRGLVVVGGPATNVQTPVAPGLMTHVPPLHI